MTARRAREDLSQRGRKISDALLGEYPCRRGCGFVLTMPGSRARHEERCITSLERLYELYPPYAIDDCHVYYRGDWTNEQMLSNRIKTQWFEPGATKQRLVYTYRIAWYYANGRIPGDYVICHTCDNGGCFKLDHLWAGTPSDNTRDSWMKGRANWQKMTPEERRAMSFDRDASSTWLPANREKYAERRKTLGRNAVSDRTQQRIDLGHRPEALPKE